MNYLLHSACHVVQLHGSYKSAKALFPFSVIVTPPPQPHTHLSICFLPFMSRLSLSLPTLCSSCSNYLSWKLRHTAAGRLFNFLSLSLPISLVQPSPHWRPMMSGGSLDQCPHLLIKSLSLPLNASTKLPAIKCLVRHNRDINTRVSSSEKPVKSVRWIQHGRQPFQQALYTSPVVSVKDLRLKPGLYCFGTGVT